MILKLLFDFSVALVLHLHIYVVHNWNQILAIRGEIVLLQQSGHIFIRLCTNLLSLKGSRGDLID